MTNYIRALYYLRVMMSRAFWNHARLREYQESRMRHIIAYAYENSAFYHKKLQKLGLKPEDFKTVSDLNKLPVIRKKDLPENVDELVSQSCEINKLRVQRTSGSTGKPLHIYMTQAENEYRKAKHLRAHMAIGQKPWDKWVTITSPLHFAESTKLQKWFRFFSVTPISVFEDLNSQVLNIEKIRPDVIDGYANSVLLLAKELKNRGLTSVRPKFAVTGAELIDGHSREFIEDVLEAPLYDQYACVEFERMAWQCKEKDEYHIDADSVIMQFVDENDEEVTPGEQGEVVCTSLFNYAMPFIRYSLEDLGVPSQKNECSCGRAFPLMKVIQGRKTSLLSLPGGRVLAPFAFMLAVWTFKDYENIDLFRVVQTRKDSILFKLKLKKHGSDERTICDNLRSHVSKVLNLPPSQVSIDVETVDDIPLDQNGKFRIVISEVNESM